MSQRAGIVGGINPDQEKAPPRNMNRICPVCSTRHAQLVDPNCPVCSGTGVLALGDAALSIYDPPVVSLAAAIALEAVARHADALTLSEDRIQPVRDAVDQLVAAGVLAAAPRPPRPATTRPRRREVTGRYATEQEPSKLAQECVQVTIVGIDAVLVNARRYQYTEYDRPNARGLPVLSANGHPSHLARVVDPEEPGNSTCATVRHRAREHQHATALAAAAPEAATLRSAHQKRNAA